MQTLHTFNTNAADRRLDDRRVGVPTGNGSKVTAGNSRDSMMASLLIDCLFGAGINQFLGDMLDLPDSMDNLDICNTVDMVDEYWTDRQNGLAGRQAARNDNQNNQGLISQKSRTNGGFELGTRGMLRGGFNRTVDENTWDLDEERRIAGFASPASESGFIAGIIASMTTAGPAMAPAMAM